MAMKADWASLGGVLGGGAWRHAPPSQLVPPASALASSYTNLQMMEEMTILNSSFPLSMSEQNSEVNNQRTRVKVDIFEQSYLYSMQVGNIKSGFDSRSKQPSKLKKFLLL